MSNDSESDTFFAICLGGFLIFLIFGMIYLKDFTDKNYIRDYETPVNVILMEDIGIDISTYTMSLQTIILQKGSPNLRYVYSGNYDSKYIIQGIKQGTYEQTFYPIYVEVGDTLSFSWSDSFGPYSSYNKETRRNVYFSESWSYKITEITNQQVTLERFKLISREWK